MPLPEQEGAWRQDYAAMSGEMFFRDPPPFDAVLETAAKFQSEFNQA